VIGNDMIYDLLHSNYPRILYYLRHFPSTGRNREIGVHLCI